MFKISLTGSTANSQYQAIRIALKSMHMTLFNSYHIMSALFYEMIQALKVDWKLVTNYQQQS
jgi:hypothetical protein